MASQNPYVVYNEFLRAGYKPHQAAAAVGRFQQESGQGLNTTIMGDKSIPGASVGIGQWNRERQAGLKAFGGDQWTDPAVQARYAIHEMGTSEKSAGDALRNAQTPEQAVNAMMGYERPQGWTAKDPTAGHGYANTINNTYKMMGQEIPANPVGTAGQAQELAANQTAMSALPTVAGATGLPALAAANQATANDPATDALVGDDATSGIFQLLMQQQKEQPMPVAAAPIRQNAADNRTPEEKMAAVSQTPNVYLDRLKRRV